MCYGNFALRLRMRMDDDGSCYQCKLLYTSPHPEISTQSIHAATSVSDVVIFQIWEGSSGGGAAVFTSSGGVYAENEGGRIDETSEVSRTERSGKLLDAEQAALGAGGAVIRLGGLYRLESGAHNFWAKGGTFPSKPAGLINLVKIRFC